MNTDTHTCALCGTEAAGFYFHTIMAADVLGYNKPRKGEAVVLCELCNSANGFVCGKEYNWRKYGDERPSSMRHDLKTRGGCPHCEVDCKVCPYAEE